MMNSKKIFSAVLASAVFALSLPSAWAITVEERGVFELQYYALKLQAVEIDIHRWMGWGELPKSEWPKELELSMARYSQLKVELDSLLIADGLKSAKDVLLEYLESSREMYRSLPQLDDERIKAKLAQHAKQTAVVNQALQDVFDRYFKGADVSGDDSLIHELNLFVDPKDRAAFQEAVEQGSRQHCTKARVLLGPLLKTHKGTPREGSILARIIDCYQISPPENDNGDELSGYLSQLHDFLTSGLYSPVMADLFGRWRTAEQMFNHGMSNMSDIPNDEYLSVQWKAALAIFEHLGRYPDDPWAKRQLALLMTLGNIERGGLMGNSNLEYYARYFHPDILDQDKAGEGRK